MSQKQPYGNIKMRGKKKILNPCPCCDDIENKLEKMLLDELNRDIWYDIVETHLASEKKSWNLGTLRKKISNP